MIATLRRRRGQRGSGRTLGECSRAGGLRACRSRGKRRRGIQVSQLISNSIQLIEEKPPRLVYGKPVGPVVIERHNKLFTTSALRAKSGGMHRSRRQFDAIFAIECN